MDDQKTSVHFLRILNYLLVIAVINLIVELWSLYFFISLYLAMHASSVLIAKNVIFLGLLWLIVFIVVIVAAIKRKRWVVFVPLLMSYPWMMHVFVAAFQQTYSSDLWAITVAIYCWSKIVFYVTSLYGIYLFLRRR